MSERDASTKWRPLMLASAAGSVACVLVLIVFVSLYPAINVPTFHLDGAFQTASGLFRLDAGQAPGRDFFPYLGIGPLLLILPFFKIAGGTLAASVFAAKFVTLALGWLAVSVLWQFIFRPGRAIFSLAGGAAVFMGAWLLANSLPIFSFTSTLPVFSALSFGFEPGNSLKPVRAALPYIVALASWLLMRKMRAGPGRDFLIGLLPGISLLWSNDFAIPTAGFFLAFYIPFLYSTEKPTWKKSAATIILAAFVTWALLLTLATLGHPLALIRYNFADVANAQWWYFGPYGEYARIFGAADAGKLISGENGFPLIVLCATMIAASVTKRLEHALLAMVGVVLFAGGCLASLGGHLGGYFEAFYFWGVATTILAALRAVQWLVEKPSPPPGSQRAGALAGLLLVPVLLVFLPGAASSFSKYKEGSASVSNDPNRFFVPELGGYLGVEWKDYIDFARAHKDSKVVEEYWGVWSSLNGSFAQWPVDSVIHALGGVRQLAKATLAGADLIISTRNVTSPEWQPWNISQNFWFHEGLLLDREPAFISPTTIVWKKTGKPREGSPVSCRVLARQDSFSLGAGDHGYYRVTIDYESAGAGRYLLMARNNISYATDADGYVSLAPDGKVATFPAFVSAESGNVFDLMIIGNDDLRPKVTTCSAKTIPYTSSEIFRAQSPDEFFLTDQRWVKGVARGHAGFFVRNKRPFNDEYKPGRYVVLPGNDVRKITEARKSGRYINVKVEGPALDPAVVGLPSGFRVVDKPSPATPGG